MKRSKADASSKQNALAWQRRDQLVDPVDRDDAMWQFTMRFIWFTLGIGCAVLGTVMTAILLG
jgi:hypothetical protein